MITKLLLVIFSSYCDSELTYFIFFLILRFIFNTNNLLIEDFQIDFDTSGAPRIRFRRGCYKELHKGGI